MDKYKVAIVDDDEVALENLSFELGKDARFFLKGTARNGKQGKKLIAKVQPDLLFLDVELPDSLNHVLIISRIENNPHIPRNTVTYFLQ